MFPYHIKPYIALISATKDLIIKSLYKLSFLIVAILLASVSASAEHTVGLQVYDSSSYNGYTLFCPMASTTTYLIDNYGREINSWVGSAQPRFSVYLRENGNLLRTIQVTGAGGETGGGFQEVDWDNNVIWEFEYFGSGYLQHHDIEPLPNGNVLILAWEHKTRTEALAAGRDPSLLTGDTLSPEHVVEIARDDLNGHKIVWEWHLWDHLVQDFDSAKTNHGVVENHPELMDINFTARSIADWNHANSVGYNPVLDQVVISARALDEIWVIDHSTTTAEAAGHTGGNCGMGGDILYRWGNQQSYRAGDDDDKGFYGQHDANWIPSGYPGEGNIMVFSNGRNRPDPQYSTIEEITPPINPDGTYPQPASGTAHGPSAATWSYIADPPTDFYSTNISGCQRLPNGNTLICSGSNGIFFEVNPNGEIVWEYINPVNGSGPLTQGDEAAGGINVFKCQRYSPDFVGLQGHDLTPKGQLEIYPIVVLGTEHSPSEPSPSDSTVITALIKGDNPIRLAQLIYVVGGVYDTTEMRDDGLHGDGIADDGIFGGAIPPLSADDAVSYYLYAEDDLGGHMTDPPLADQIVYSFTVLPGAYLCGDVNNDESVNILDVSYIIQYAYLGGPEPIPFESGDVNNTGNINILDVTYLISYLYNSGPIPNCR